MHSALKLIATATALTLLAGCASNNPYDQQANQGSSNKTAIYGGLGALAGAAVGAATSSKRDRTKGVLIGAAIGGAAAGGYGYYLDRQEAELRRSMQGTGIDIQREGDLLTLVMPGNVTFATGSDEIAGNFYGPLNDLARSLQQYNQSIVEVVGHTDNTGSRSFNMQLSKRRAQSVGYYLESQGVASQRLNIQGVGPDQPIASNSTAQGRQDNRRVEVQLRPMQGAYE